jgi:hypothetical protein
MLNYISFRRKYVTEIYLDEKYTFEVEHIVQFRIKDTNNPIIMYEEHVTHIPS